MLISYLWPFTLPMWLRLLSELSFFPAAVSQCKWTVIVKIPMSDYHRVLLFLDKITANSTIMITAPSVVESRKRAVGLNWFLQFFCCSAVQWWDVFWMKIPKFSCQSGSRVSPVNLVKNKTEKGFGRQWCEVVFLSNKEVNYYLVFSNWYLVPLRTYL